MHETAPRSEGPRSSSLPRNIGALAVTLAAYAGAISAAHAQTGDSVIQGRVIAADTKGPINEVIVTVRSQALQGEHTVITDTSGFYRVPNLPPGLYIVRFDKENHSSFERGKIELRSSTTLRVDGAMVPDNVKGEEIYLVETPPTIDVGSSSVATTISSDMARRVPIARPGSAKGSGVRSYESMAQAAPEARVDTYGTGIAGTTSPENRYVIDGMAVNNPAYGLGTAQLSTEFIQEVNVVSGGYMPEHGRATGGVLNVVTKSGSNKASGGAWYNLTPGTLEGTRKTYPRAEQTIGFEQAKIKWITDVGGEIGGPILRDKLWYYVGADYTFSSYDVTRNLYQTQLTDTGMPVVDERGFTVRNLIPGTEVGSAAQGWGVQGIAKLTYAPTKHHSVSLSFIGAPTRSGGDGNYGIDPQTGDPDLGGFGTYSALARIYETDSYDSLLKWTATNQNRRFIVDTTFGWHHENARELPPDGSKLGSASGQAGLPFVNFRKTNPVHAINDFMGPELGIPPGFCVDEPPTAPAWRKCPAASYSIGGTGIIRDASLDRYQLRSVLTVVGELLGHHVMKGGVDVELVTYNSRNAYTGGVALRETPDGEAFVETRNFGYLTGPDQATYLDSYATATKAFTVGGFLQNSWSVLDKVTVNLGMRYDAQFMYDTFDKVGLSLPNQWSPRLGFIYDPTQRGRSRIFGSYARYYQNVPLDLADRALSGEPQLAGATRLRSDCDPRVGTMSTGSCRATNNLQPIGDSATPDQFYEPHAGTTPIDPDLKPSSLDEIILGGEVEVVESRLGLTYSRRRLNQAIEDMSRDEGATLFIGNPGSGIAKDFPKARRDYDAFSLYFSRAFQNRWLAQASYTLSWLRGNYAGLFRPETGQLNPNINSDFDLQSLLPNRDGPLPGDRRHQIKVFTARDWALGRAHNVQTGVGARGGSSGPTNWLGSHPLYGAGEVFLLPRGSGPRVGWSYSLDLRLGYNFAFADSFTLGASLDVYNVLNLQADAAIDQTFTRADVLPVQLPPGEKPSEEAIRKYGQRSNGTQFQVDDLKNKNYGRPTASQAPRIFQFGLRGTF